MFYRLKSSYALRGWEELSWVLIRRPENSIQILSQGQFQVLLLCDGQTELPGNLLDEPMTAILKQSMDDHLVESLEEPCPLDPDQYYHYYRNRYTSRVFWSVTGRCNFRCRHCYMDAPDTMLGELSTVEALSLIDQMAECGVLRVDITGGEPLVRGDLWQLIDRILSYKMTIGQFYTNGWLLDEKVLDEFEKRGLKPEIAVSFDGVGWHDWMRRVAGAEEASLRALKLCRERGFPVSVGICIHRGNKDTLPFGFVWGILLFKFKDSFVKWMQNKWFAKCLILCVTAGLLGISYLKLKPVVFYGDYLLKILLGISITVFMLAVNTHVCIGNRVSNFLGSISYEVYLLHGTVFGLINFIMPSIESGLFILFSIVITVVLSKLIQIFSKRLLHFVRIT